MSGLDGYHEVIDRLDPYGLGGSVTQVIGLVIEATGPEARIGELCRIRHDRRSEPVDAEVVGFREGRTLLMPIGPMEGISPGDEVVATGHPMRIPVGPGLLGRVLDGAGRPMDDRGELSGITGRRPLHAAPPSALSRERIDSQLPLGVRCMDALIPCGRGQRLGVFAGSGVGKSSLLGMMARGTAADINVIALVGERGREVREFIERDLGEEGMARTVIVCATGDEPALMRINAAFAATAIAESFRDEGHDVLLMMDSVTRFALAQREIGLAIGEPPATRGYTPSVFAALPRLLERAGTAERGSITGLYTVLVEGDDMNEPVADSVRGILDGHVVLSRRLAHRNHFPAIDVLQSVSRLQSELLEADEQRAAAAIRRSLATYAEKEDLITIGAYAVGSDPHIDYAIAKKHEFDGFLRQDLGEVTGAPEARSRMVELAADALPDVF